MRYVMNSPVLTAYGYFRFQGILEHEAIEWLEKGEWESAVGHESTATLMTERLGIPISFRRQTIRMLRGDEALVLRIMSRLPQGTRLTLFEMSRISCEYGLISRIE